MRATLVLNGLNSKEMRSLLINLEEITRLPPTFLQKSSILQMHEKLTLADLSRYIFETNSSFHVKERSTGTVQSLFFRRFLLVLAKFSFCEED